MNTTTDLVTGARAPALPAAYAPLLPALALLAKPLRDIVGGHLLQFERARAHFAATEQHVMGDLDGFDGLSLQGDFSHILQSELLLRTEAPMEFVRRLSESETLFMKKSYVDPGAHATYRLIISGGPALLGHGRIAALSALFFFSRIAEERGAKFYWTFAPRWEGPRWFDTLTVSTIRAFLEAASFRDVTTKDIGDLEKTYGEISGETDDAALITDWLLFVGDLKTSEVCRQVARVLSVQVQLPDNKDEREARLSIVRQGQTRRTFSVHFPGEDLCVGALREPFAPRPVSPPRPRARQGDSVKRPEKLAGWAPTYFMSPYQGQFVIRMTDGLLFLSGSWGSRKEATRFTSFWLDVPDTVTLAGVNLMPESCAVAFHGRKNGEELFWKGFAILKANQPGPIWFKTSNEHSYPSRQLFAKHPRFALPCMDAVFPSEPEIYSSLGQVFKNSRVFSIDQQAGSIIFDNGAFRAFVGRRPYESAQLSMHRYSGPCVALYKALEDVRDPRAMFGALFDHTDSIFCYSTEPGLWQVLHQGAETQTIRMQIGDQPVSIRAKDGGHEVRAWSDARYGGDGGVRLVQHRNGEVLSSRVHFNFDEVDGTIGKYIVLPDSSAWAIVLDEEGNPQTLVRCRRARKSRTYAFQPHDLKELRSNAQTLKMSVQFD